MSKQEQNNTVPNCWPPDRKTEGRQDSIPQAVNLDENKVQR